MEKGKTNVDTLVENCISVLFPKEHTHILETAIVNETKKKIFVKCIVEYNDGTLNVKAVLELTIQKSNGVCFFEYGKITEWREIKKE